MLCRNPFVKDRSGKFIRLSVLTGDPDLRLYSQPFPCGQCLPCRINRRRVWTHRLILERTLWTDACFVTLTYDDEHLPPHGVDKDEVQRFLKRLRKAIAPLKIRYYLCAEYGEHTLRPHYHAIFFNLSESYAQLIANCWSYGGVCVGSATPDSMQYVAGYITKKLVKSALAKYGFAPEFSLMSRKPGLGSGVVDSIIEVLRGYVPDQATSVDLPPGLLHSRRLLPFGRYLRSKIELAFGVDIVSSPQILQQYCDFLSSKTGIDFTDYLVRSDDGRAESIKARYTIYKRSIL